MFFRKGKNIIYKLRFRIASVGVFYDLSEMR